MERALRSKGAVATGKLAFCAGPSRIAHGAFASRSTHLQQLLQREAATRMTVMGQLAPFSAKPANDPEPPVAAVVYLAVSVARDR